MSELPLISVIVPVYNVETYLDKSLQTLVSQTYRNLEIILVDDGSTDNSGNMCDAWAQKDSRVRVIHQANAGPSCARNAGIDSASGEYILFFDSDDLLSPDLCQVLYNALLDKGDIAICDCEHIFPDRPYSFLISEENEIFTPEEVIAKTWYQTKFIPSACARLYHQQVFGAHRFTPNLIFEDIDLIHEIYWDSSKIVYNHSKLYGYVHRKSSITTTQFSIRDMDILRVVEKILCFAETKPNLQGAAEAYATTAALRIYLNAPRCAQFQDGISQAEAIIARYGKKVMFDSNARKKNRYALMMYFLCKPVLRFVYKHINRWK